MPDKELHLLAFDDSGVHETINSPQKLRRHGRVGEVEVFCILPCTLSEKEDI